MSSRRHFLLLAATVPVLGLPSLRASARTSLPQDPFTLGVASGYPLPGGLALWTRLAPQPLAPDGGMPMETLPVRWEVAEDDGFKRIAASGDAWAEPAWGHSVHAEPAGLEPGREYWYRFHAGGATSPVGRSKTAPAPDADVQSLRFAFMSCQHYEQGHYAAYRQVAADALDLVLHLGDYIYESSWGTQPVRRHVGPEPVTLTDYRVRYAQYKTDPLLQAAHAASPWACVWDDHEVENDYANDRSENLDDPAWFLQRRAAAYQAWYEHMPARRSMVPFGPALQLYGRLGFGRLAQFNLLDGRQYRTPQPCPKPGRGGANSLEDCAARLDPTASMLGPRQEAWLAASLAGTKARWNFLAQQTLMAQTDSKAGPGHRFFSDGWDGYPAARQRLFRDLENSRVTNPVSLGGDVHSFWVSDLKRDFDQPSSATLATELVGGSITSQPGAKAMTETVMQECPHVRFATGAQRGYMRATLTPSRMETDVMVVDEVRDPASAVRKHSSWVVEDGRPGAVRV